MENFETDDNLYKLQKSKRKSKFSNNYIFYIIIISQIIISIYLFKYIKSLEKDIQYLKFDNQKLKQNSLNNNKAPKSNNVLLISNVFTDDDNVSPPLLYNLLKNISFISNIKIIHPSTILNELTESNLINYNIVIFDLKQHGYENTRTKIDYIKHYISHSGNIIVTHDHWTALAGPQELFGGFRSFKEKGSVTNKAYIVNKRHKIFNSYYDLSENENVDISPTHSGWMQVNESLKNENTVLMKLKDEINSEYLMQREIGLGKCVFWNVGHEYYLTEFEIKLLTNILAWFCD